jgi:hypothetical protein
MPWPAWVAVGVAACVLLSLIVVVVRSVVRVHAAPHDEVVADLATLLMATPNLRARFFADPTREIGKRLPARKYWEYGLKTPPWNLIATLGELRKTRAAIAQKIVCRIARQIDDGQLTSSINTDAVFAEFFAPIVRVSQRSFYTVFFLSCGTFLGGLGLIGCGVWIAVDPPSDTNSTVVASIFGGAGTIGALGSVYAMAKQGIREATIDHARLRMVLTAFATQLGQLRAVAERPPDDADKPPNMDEIRELNNAIGFSMAGAVGLVPSVIAQSGGDEQQAPQQPRARRFFRRRN